MEQNYSSANADLSPREVFDRWNKFAANNPKLQACRELTDDRLKKLKSRLANKKWLPALREACKSLPIPDDGWQPTFDWLIKNQTNVFRVIEGAFEWRLKNDPAAAKLARDKRKRAAEASQAQAKQAKAEAPKTRNAIESILPAKNGGEDVADGASLLFGADTISSASGAACRDPNGSQHPKNESEPS